MCFELKNYVIHKFRIRRQKEVRRINQFYYELLEKSIPEELRQYSYNTENDAISVPDSVENSSTSSTGKQDKKLLNNGKIKPNKWNNLSEISDPISQSSSSTINGNLSSTITEFLNALPSSEESSFQDTSNTQDLDDVSSLVHRKPKSRPTSNGSVNGAPVLAVTDSYHNNTFSDNCKSNKEDYLNKLEIQIKKVKSELQSSKKSESDYKSQLLQVQQSETQMKTELKTIKGEIPPTQTKLQQTQQRFASEKQTSQMLEKRLTEEKKIRQQLQNQLDSEKKFRQEDSEINAKAIQAVAVAAARSAECGDACKKQRKDMEAELTSLRRDVRIQEDRITLLSRQAVEWPNLVRIADEYRDLMSHIATVKDENLHLTEQLRELNKMKQELLTSYHCSQLEIKELDYVLKKKNYQIFELQSKLQTLLPMTDYGSAGTTHSYGMESSGHCQHNYQSYSPSYTHQSNSGSGRHSTNNSPLYMPYSTSHSP